MRISLEYLLICPPKNSAKTRYDLNVLERQMKKKQFTEEQIVSALKQMEGGRRACGLLGIDRSSFRYQAARQRDEVVKQELGELARKHLRYGYRRLTVLLCRAGQAANHKRVWRLYHELELGVRGRI